MEEALRGCLLLDVDTLREKGEKEAESIDRPNWSMLNQITQITMHRRVVKSFAFDYFERWK